MTKITFNEISVKNSEEIIRKLSKQDPLKYISEKKQSISDNKSPPISKIYRQGDILFKKIPSLPSHLKEKPDKVIAEGELTGHAHVLDNGAVFELLNSDSKLIVKADQKTRIIHDEHLPIKLEPGNYEVIRQREYLGAGLRRVVRD